MAVSGACPGMVLTQVPAKRVFLGLRRSNRLADLLQIPLQR